MQPGILVRLNRAKALYDTIEVRSGSQGEFKTVPMFAIFTILPDMVGMCIEGGKGVSMKVLFGDKLVWVGKDVVEPLEDNG